MVDPGSEGGSDIWLRPADTSTKETRASWLRRVFDVFIVALGFVLCLLGTVLIFQGQWARHERLSEVLIVPMPTRQDLEDINSSVVYGRNDLGRIPHESSPLLPSYAFAYVIFSITIELLCLSVTLTGMLCVALTLGESSLKHSLSMFSIANDIGLAFAYAGQAIWGNLVLWQLFLTNYSFELHRLQLPSWSLKALFLYVALTTALATGYAFSRLPTLWGLVGFALYHVRKKCDQQPIVQFYKQYNPGDDFYVRVVPKNDYAQYVGHMKNPTIARHPPHSGGTRARGPPATVGGTHYYDPPLVINRDEAHAAAQHGAVSNDALPHDEP